MRKNLYILVGPSGAGKTTVFDILVENFGFVPVRSYTTRQPRFYGENSYRFVTEEQFFAAGEMVTGMVYHGNRYGATAGVIDDGDLYIVEPSGVYNLLSKYHNRKVVVIGITCSLKTLEARLYARGDKPDNIKARLEGDCTQFGMMTDFCDVVFRNEGPLCDLVESVTNYIDMWERRTTKTN